MREKEEKLIEDSDFLTVCGEAAYDSGVVSGFCIKSAVAVSEEINELRLENVVFENCRMSESRFRKAEFIDVQFRKCDFSNCNMHGAYFKRCSFVSCKFVGADFGESGLSDVSVTGGNFRYADFGSSDFDTVSITGADFSNAVLSECSLKKLRLDEAVLVAVNFFKTSLKGVDLSTSRTDGMVISSEMSEIKGATVNACQAAELALMLGVKIK